MAPAPAQNLEFALADAAALAQAAMEQAVDFCAGKMALDGRAAVQAHLRQGDRVALGYLSYGLAERAAEWLGAWDHDVKAVYLFDCDATPDDVCFGEAKQPEHLHLIVWTMRKTGALSSMLEALDRGLAQAWAGLMGKSGLTTMLDAQVIDDDDVRNSLDCGALLSSLHTRPLRIWER
jgi:hypothetical protein